MGEKAWVLYNTVLYFVVKNVQENYPTNLLDMEFGPSCSHPAVIGKHSCLLPITTISIRFCNILVKFFYIFTSYKHQFVRKIPDWLASCNLEISLINTKIKFYFNKRKVFIRKTIKVLFPRNVYFWACIFCDFIRVMSPVFFNKLTHDHFISNILRDIHI